jgi:hypothetical protein
MADQQDPLSRIYRLYVDVETRAASALESLVGTNAFGELLATSASNAMALARLANGSIDRGVRALRVAGRADVTDLARQLARTEDKLERMLQLVEELEGRLDANSGPLAEAGPPAGARIPAAAGPSAGAAGSPATRPVPTGRGVAAGQNGAARKASSRTTTTKRPPS